MATVGSFVRYRRPSRVSSGLWLARWGSDFAPGTAGRTVGMPATESPAGTAHHDRVHRQLLRFGAVGVMNGVIDLGVFNLLTIARPTHSSAVLAAYNTVAVVGAIANSYFWNSRWTFGRYRIDQRGGARNRRRALFLAQGVFNIGVNDAVVVALAAFFGAFKVLPAAVANNMAKLVAMLVASLASFAAMRLLVFRSPASSRWPPGRSAKTSGNGNNAEADGGPHEPEKDSTWSTGGGNGQVPSKQLPRSQVSPGRLAPDQFPCSQLPRSHPPGSASLDASVGPHDPRA